MTAWNGLVFERFTMMPAPVAGGPILSGQRYGKFRRFRVAKIVRALGG
jgi:hypothetical protein